MLKNNDLIFMAKPITLSNFYAAQSQMHRK